MVRTAETEFVFKQHAGQPHPLLKPVAEARGLTRRRACRDDGDKRKVAAWNWQSKAVSLRIRYCRWLKREYGRSGTALSVNMAVLNVRVCMYVYGRWAVSPNRRIPDRLLKSVTCVFFIA